MSEGFEGSKKAFLSLMREFRINEMPAEKQRIMKGTRKVLRVLVKSNVSKADYFYAVPILLSVVMGSMPDKMFENALQGLVTALKEIRKPNTQTPDLTESGLVV